MNGFINILKPPGMTSAAVVATLRRLTGGEKAGHAGTLDPEAAGVLPVMVGRAARLFDLMAYPVLFRTGTRRGGSLRRGQAIPPVRRWRRRCRA